MNAADEISHPRVCNGNSAHNPFPTLLTKLANHGRKMLPTVMSAIDEKLLASVCDERWPESQTLEFKQLLAGTVDKSQHEFLKNICAFANSSGGDIVCGVREKSGRADRPAPISR